MFEVDVNGLTQQYRTKPTMNVDITGSSGVQPDWNQNDSTAADYVKNRPGGYTVVTKKKVLTSSGTAL